MSLRNSRYDPELQMFADEPRDLDLAHLRFLRWLGERDRLEHPPAGPPTGLYAFRAVANAGDARCPIEHPEDLLVRAEARHTGRAML